MACIKVHPTFAPTLNEICGGIISAVATLGQNAPMGVSILCQAVNMLVDQIRLFKMNEKIIMLFLDDLKALPPILEFISRNMNPNLITSLNNMSNAVISIAEIIKEHKKKWKILQFMQSSSLKEKLNLAVLQFQMCKNTLQLAQNANPRHVIPGSIPAREAAVAPFSKLEDIGDSQCMMIKPSTNMRCDTIFPNFSLVSRTTGPQTIYHVCGHCAKANSTWWRKAYKRVERT